VDDAPEITVLQLPKFKSEATGLIGSDGVEAVARHLPSRRWRRHSGLGRSAEAAMGSEGQREAWRSPHHLPVRAIAARIYLIRCYAKNVQTDLTADEKKQLRQIAAHLKGAQ
jgi:hypothetical protein